MKIPMFVRMLATTLLLAGLAACGGGSGSASGTLRLALTDAPACGYDEVNVTIEKVRVHQSGSAGENDGGWSDVVLETPQRVNLLTLTNGVLMELGQTALPAGKYTQLRLVLAANTPANPMANSVVPTGGAEVALTTPSGQQSGLKIHVNIDVAADQLADFVLDFDACKSVVVAGNSNSYNLKPVLRAIPRSLAGVTGVATVPGSAVSLQLDGVVVRSTTAVSTASDPSGLAMGGFLLQPVEPGTYTLVVTAPGQTTAVVKDVVVPEGQVVVVGSAPIAPPASPDKTTLSSSVSTGTTPVDALVSLRKILGGGLQIELGSMMVDAETGTAIFPDLPRTKPEVATFSVTGAPLTFVPDTEAAGALTVRATSGSVTKNQDITLTAPAQSVSFTFP